jgi:SAM-dependent methyltransferase
MARITYDDAQAAAFAATRDISDEGLDAWRTVLRPHLANQGGAHQGRRLLDLGAGTGWWSHAFTTWFDLDVLAVEPAAAMRARCGYPRLVAGTATRLPLRNSTMDAAWLSTVVHHLPDLGVAAHELRRVVRPDGVVLIRSAFPGGQAGIRLFDWFPEAGRVVDTFPSVATVAAAFAAAGFTLIHRASVPQRTAASLQAVAASLRREAHSPLVLISDAEYAAGLARLRRAADQEHPPTPVVDFLELLVLR